MAVMDAPWTSLSLVSIRVSVIVSVRVRLIVRVSAIVRVRVIARVSALVRVKGGITCIEIGPFSGLVSRLYGGRGPDPDGK
jgi:hypothetical protein